MATYLTLPDDPLDQDAEGEDDLSVWPINQPYAWDTPTAGCSSYVTPVPAPDLGFYPTHLDPTSMSSFNMHSLYYPMATPKNSGAQIHTQSNNFLNVNGGFGEGFHNIV
jgi:hypothetical protein